MRWLLALLALQAAEPPQQFVQRFYDWYVQHGTVMDSAVAHQPSVLSPTLLAALRADEEAQAKNTEEVTGLDFDPFVNSQDPCERYVAGTPVPSGQHFRVDVFGVCDGKKSKTPDLVAEIEPKGDAWVFVNFYYPESKTDLRTVLKRLLTSRQEKR